MDAPHYRLSITTPSTWLVAAAFVLTLGVYRVPTPVGYNATFYHLLLGGALYFGVLAFFAGAMRLHLAPRTRGVVVSFILYAAYSFILLLKNLVVIQPNNLSNYLSEMMGYVLLFAAILLVDTFPTFRRTVAAFLASNVFLYLGAFWHLYNFAAFGRIVTGVPFWRQPEGEFVNRDISFMGFPRLRLPFSTPSDAGVYLSLTGILFLALVLHRMSRREGRNGLLLTVLFLNFLCLIGTMARASWSVFLLGGVVVFSRYRSVVHVRLRYVVVPIVAGIILLSLLANTLPVVNEALHFAALRFDPQAMRGDNKVHLMTRLLALHYWEESPLWGLGIGGFSLKPGAGVHTHSTYFTILVERGLIGLFLYLLFFAMLYRMLLGALRDARNRGDWERVPYLVGFLGGLTGLAVGNLLYQMWPEYVSFFFGLGIACVNTMPEGKKPSEVSPAT